jgi:ribosomal protein L3 glutamine methyltransferase
MSTGMSENPQQQLQTVRDWLRYAVSRFNRAGLVYGHGTASALEEASYLVLHTLQLPIDQLDPWLDARLLPSERQAVCAVIERRIATRKPAAYLTREAWIQQYAFYVDERVIVPRSYIGELLCHQIKHPSESWHLGFDPRGVGRVLDLCTGSGCLAILAALAFPSSSIDASDLSTDALAVAERNVADYGLQHRISLLHSDLFAGVRGRRYDLVFANPPYVSAEALAAFPPEYAAEPRIAHAGGDDGQDVVRRILAEAGEFLTSGGSLLVEVGTGRGILEAEFPRLPFLWLDSAESQGEVFQLPASALQAAGAA